VDDKARKVGQDVGVWNAVHGGKHTVGNQNRRDKQSELKNDDKNDRSVITIRMSIWGL